MAFEVLDKSVEDDSDSEDEGWDQQNLAKTKAESLGLRDTESAFAGLSLGKAAAGKAPMMLPSSKAKAIDERDDEEEQELQEEDEDDPFADRNEVNTPRVERPGMTW